MKTFHHLVAGPLVACGLALIAMPANALTISAGDIPGNNTVNFYDGGSWSATSSPRNFQSKTFNGATGLGVAGGFVDGEIDLADNEQIAFNFTTPQTLDQITLAFMYPAGVYGDSVSEVARVQLATGGFVAGDLSVIDATHATWSGPGGGAVINVSPAVSNSAGVWEVQNPFGDTPVTGLSMYALQVGGQPASAANSDFSFVSLAGTDVPEPASLALLLSGVLGLGTLRRRKGA